MRSSLRCSLCRRCDGQEIWQSGLWWPTTLKDAIRYAKECDLCQQMGQPTEQAQMPHQPVLPLEPFQKWGLDFVGPFKPPTMRTGNRYVIVARDYYTRVEYYQDDVVYV